MKRLPHKIPSASGVMSLALRNGDIVMYFDAEFVDFSFPEPQPNEVAVGTIRFLCPEQTDVFLLMPEEPKRKTSKRKTK